MALSAWPESVADYLEKQWQRLEEAFADDSASLTKLNALAGDERESLEKVIVASDYVVDQWVRRPALFVEILNDDNLQRRFEPGEIRGLLQQALADVADDKELDKCLREFRRNQMIRIIWRDVCRLASFEEVTRDLSHLADACITETINVHREWMASVWGAPYYEGSDQPMPMVVLGMGKLGAYELNLSSDIDLIFGFPHEGETCGGSRSLAHRDFFARLGQRLIKSLDKINADGFVFRVDMRLRPYGSAGALALSFDAMETYYEEQGREWERYAMIKARPIGDDHGEGEKLLKNLRPFVYRRYIDFGVIESLREMKALINREVMRKGAVDNVKTGSGGIREVEFIVQAFQLIRGGQDKELQERSLLKVLSLLVELELFPAEAASELREAYIFLRDCEHRIQAQADRQTQDLPEDDIDRLRLAATMGHSSWDTFAAELDKQRHVVRNHFEAVIAPPAQEKEEAEDNADAQMLWLDKVEEDEAHEMLLDLGFKDAELAPAWATITDLKEDKTVLHLQAIPRQRLDKMMPLVIMACAEQENSLIALERVVPLVEAILRRSAYISLLVENPHALDRLASLSGASRWVAEVMSLYPVLLDELIDPDSLYSPPPVSELKNELRQLMLRIPEDDFEQQMECLRQFKKVHLLRVAASEITGSLSVMKVSDYLTWVAETVLQEVLDLAWKQMVGRYGYPTREDGAHCDPDFIIVAYGKMGGIELSYSSDLDLVFIHHADTSKSTTGDRSVDNNVFFTRLGQRIIHILSTRTASGMLYETDMRLRPSGNSGLLVASLKAFEQYQLEKAWTWEKQALVRARVVAGCADLSEAFQESRARVLGEVREPDQLIREVLDMRYKMLDHLSTFKKRELEDSDLVPDREFNIKQDPGGMVDIEFVTQYLVLRYSSEYPSLLEYPDNMRILESIQAVGLLSPDDVDTLSQAYLNYRSETHVQALQSQDGKVPGDVFADERRMVREIWHRLLPEMTNSENK